MKIINKTIGKTILLIKDYFYELKYNNNISCYSFYLKSIQKINPNVSQIIFEYNNEMDDIDCDNKDLLLNLYNKKGEIIFSVPLNNTFEKNENKRPNS